MSLTVTTLDASTWDAFAELLERNNGIFGGCWFSRFLGSATVELFDDFDFSRRRPVGKHAWIVDKIVEASS